MRQESAEAIRGAQAFVQGLMHLLHIGLDFGSRDMQNSATPQCDVRSQIWNYLVGCSRLGRCRPGGDGQVVLRRSI
jgi:hypothetical protein